MHRTLTLLLFLFASTLSALPEGLTYTTEEGHDNTLIHLLEVDPQQFEIRPALAGDEKYFATKELSTFASHAVAAVNGGFFERDGTPAGVLRISDNWYAFPKKLRGAIGWDDEQVPHFSKLTMRGHVVIDRRIGVHIHGLNRPYQNEPMIYSPAQFQRTEPGRESVQFYVKDGTIIGFRETSHDPTHEADWMFVVNQKIWRYISRNDVIGMPIELRVKFNDKDPVWHNLSNIVGGAPLLISDGEKITDFSPENTRRTFLTKRHARTAVGVLENGNWLFVVVEEKTGFLSNDGGMTMGELADFMEEQGCIHALNLDGGSSSTLLLEGEVVSRLPRGRETPIGDGILILQKPN